MTPSVARAACCERSERNAIAACLLRPDTLNTESDVVVINSLQMGVQDGRCQSRATVTFGL